MATSYNENKSKNLVLNSVMKNPKLFRTVSDALSAPLGSTKRQEALSILRSINKLGVNYFGQGGNPLSSLAGGLSLSPEGGLNVPDYAAQTKQYGPLTVSGTSRTLFGNTSDVPESLRNIPAIPTPTQPTPSQPVNIPAGTYQPTGTPVVNSSASANGTTVVPDPTTSSVSALDQQYIDLLENYPESFESAYQNFSEADKKKLEPLYNAVKSQLGAGYFSWDVMNNPEKWAQMGLPADERPTGAILVNQLKELEETLKNENNITEQENKLRQMMTTGVTLQSDLNAYIKTKDENIKNIDNLINKTRDAMSNMDMSNPETQKRVTSYINYLTVLKGRQQKSYDQYLTDSIDIYNNQMEVANNKLTADKQAFLTEYNTQANLLSSDFDRKYTAMTSMLGEMYTNAVNMESNAMDVWNARANQITNAKSMMDTVLDSGTGGGGNDVYRYPSQYKAYLDQFNKNINPEATAVKDEINILSGDITSMMNNAAYFEKTEDENLNPESIIKLINDNISATAEPAMNAGKLDQYWNNFKPMIEQYFADYSTKENFSAIDIQNAAYLAQNLISKIGSRYKEDLTNDSVKLANFTSALTNLIGASKGTIFGIGKTEGNFKKVLSNTEKAKWIDTYSKEPYGIDKLILEAIHTDIYNVIKNTPDIRVSDVIPADLYSDPERIALMISSGLSQMGILSNILQTNAALTGQ